MIKTAIIIERADIALGGAERSVFELASQLSLADVIDFGESRILNQKHVSFFTREPFRHGD